MTVSRHQWSPEFYFVCINLNIHYLYSQIILFCEMNLGLTAVTEILVVFGFAFIITPILENYEKLSFILVNLILN